MRALYLDCFSGISGDMTVGALCDLGVSPSAFEWELSKIDLGDFHTHFKRESRQHIEGVKFTIHEGAVHRHEQDEPAHAHGHPHHDHGGHHHDHHGHGHHHDHGRSHRDIRELLERSDLSPFVKRHALGIFQRIAVAEAKIHGTTPGEVTFHEVGALDSIADIACVCFGIEQLGVERVLTSPLVEGRGWIDSAHGRFPVPAPATLEILAGTPIEQIDQPREFITPTGAGILAEFAHSFAPMPRLSIGKIGYGVGSRHAPDRPNVLRAILGDLEESAGYATDTITRLETNLDDLSPEMAGAVMDRLFAAGALDVFFTPIHMKKNRPAFMLTLLCERDAADALAGIVFRETSAFGLRRDDVARMKLDRRMEQIDTEFGPIDVKLGLRNGEVIQTAPELESCRAAADVAGVPLRAVYEAASRRAPRK